MVDNKSSEASSNEMSQSECPVNSPHHKNCTISSTVRPICSSKDGDKVTINDISSNSNKIHNHVKIKMNREKTESPSYVSSCSESSSHSLEEDNEKNEEDNEVEVNEVEEVNNETNINNDNNNDFRETITHEATNDSSQFFIGESESNLTTTRITNDIVDSNNTNNDSNIIIQEESQETLAERVKSLEAQLQSLTNLLTNILQSPQETMVSTSCFM